MMNPSNHFSSQREVTHSANGESVHLLDNMHHQISTAAAHGAVASAGTNNVKAKTMSSAFIRYRNAINNIQLSDFVDKCRARAPRGGISVETTRVLKRVMKPNPEPEADPDNQSENSAEKVLKTRKPRGVDHKPIAKQGVSLAETHVQYAGNFPQHHTMLCLKQVIERTGLSRSTIYNKIDTRSKHHDPKFPKQIVMGSCSVRWLDSEIEEWINCRINFSRCGRESD